MKTVLLLVVVAVVGVAFIAGCGGHHRGKFSCKSPDKIAKFITNNIAKGLNLNEEQKAKLNSIKEEIVSMHQNNKTDHQAMHTEIKTLILSDQIDAAQLNSLIDQKLEKHGEMKDFLVSKFVEFHAILTPEQRQKLVDKLEKHHKHFENSK
jgi:periplasmic protein CpxP/Spy